MTEMGTEEPTTWESYEDVARYLLGQVSDALGLGLETVEGKQTLVGESGAKWEIDGKGVNADDGATVVVECRRYTTSKVKQSAVASLAWTISDLGASGGIVVTPIGVQAGGRLIAESADIRIIRLNENATITDYVMEFLDKVSIGRSFSVTLATSFGFSASAEVESNPAERG
jgi:hypothetical protein